MAYDEDLANRIRELIAGDPDLTERKMFGGLAFLVGANMSVGDSGQGGLMVRVDPKDTDALVTKPHARPFEMRGRPMQGWLRVDAERLLTKRELEPWVRRGVALSSSKALKPFGSGDCEAAQRATPKRHRSVPRLALSSCRGRSSDRLGVAPRRRRCRGADRALPTLCHPALAFA